MTPELSRQGFLSRASWVFIDQGLSSIGNFVVAIAIAHAISPTAFGAFTLGFTCYLAVLNLSQSVSSEPFVVRYSASSRSGGVANIAWRSGVGRCTGTALMVGILASIGAAIAAIAVDGMLRGIFVALAVSFPGLLLQDSWRFIFFARGTPAAAALNDSIWTGLQFALIMTLLTFSDPSAAVLMLAWGLPATVAAAVGMAQARTTPKPWLAPKWVKAHWDLAPRYVAEFAVFRTSKLLSLYVVGVVAGLAALGTLRAAIVLLGPITFVFTGSALFAVPEAARLLQTSVSRMHRFIVLLSVSLVCFALAAAACVAALPDALGRWTLGETWVPVEAILVPIAAGVAGSGAMFGPWVGLRALGAASAGLRAGCVVAGITVLGAMIGVTTGGVRGAALGLAVASWSAACVWWRQYTRAKRAMHVSQPAIFHPPEQYGLDRG